MIFFWVLVLTLLGTIVKLLGFIDWSWFWIVSPVWISLVCWLLLCFVATSAYLKNPETGFCELP